MSESVPREPATGGTTYTANDPARGAVARALALEWGVEEWTKVVAAWGTRCRIYRLEGENGTRCAKCGDIGFDWEDWS